MKKVVIACMVFILLGTGIIKAQEEKNTYMYKVGDYDLILLSEGQQKGNKSILIDPSPEMIQETMPDGTFPNATNAFLLKTPGKNYLIDTGFGRKLFDNLQAVGVTPEDIHSVIITHMHGDHIGGLMKDGNKTFPNAKIVIGKVERDYWSSDVEMNKLPENRRGGFTSARNVLEVYDSNIQLVQTGKVSSKSNDGIYFIEAYGHTPGHLAVLIKSGNEQILVWGDLIHAMAIQMPYPQIAVTYDVDPDTAIKSREAILEFVAKHKIPIAGMHIPYPAIGNIDEAVNGGYTFVPIK